MRISDWSSDVCSSDLYGIGSYGERQEYYGQRSTPRQYAGSGFSEGGGRAGGRGRGGGGRMSYKGDSDYHQWRNRQIEARDREYDDYRRERPSRFEIGRAHL